MQHNSSTNLGERLRNELSKEGIGLSKAARHLGKAWNTIDNWCKKGNIPANLLEQLAPLGVDTCYVVTGQVLVEENISETKCAVNGAFGQSSKVASAGHFEEAVATKNRVTEGSPKLPWDDQGPIEPLVPAADFHQDELLRAWRDVPLPAKQNLLGLMRQLAPHTDINEGPANGFIDPDTLFETEDQKD